jgi:transposase-like protein
MADGKTSVRKTYDDGFKAKVVLEALKETMPLSALASKYEIHPNLIMQWRSKFLELAPGIFGRQSTEHEEIERLRH